MIISEIFFEIEVWKISLKSSKYKYKYAQTHFKIYIKTE